MHTQGYALSPNTKNPHSLDSWGFYYLNAAGNKDNIKIEINYSMRNHILPFVENVIGIDFIPAFKVRALAPLELFGSKVKALIERTAARDLYDVHNMVTQSIFSDEDLNLLRKIIIFYMAVGGSKPPQTHLNLDTIDNLKFSQIRASLLPVLKKNEYFDFENAKIIVKDFLLKLLVLTDKEKKFVEDYNNRVYSPCLLFDDKEIIRRIKEHPMAIWKTRPIQLP